MPSADFNSSPTAFDAGRAIIQAVVTMLNILIIHSRRTVKLLHRSAGEHLLTEMVLVCSDGSVPPSNRLVLAHHDVLCNFV